MNGMVDGITGPDQRSRMVRFIINSVYTAGLGLDPRPGKEFNMAYDLELAGRIRQVLSNQEDISEKKMFGGIAFLVNGNMACGVHGQNLIVRLPPSQGRSALAQPHTRPFDLSGKPMAGWIYVEPAGCAADPDLVNWVNQGTAYARALPLKH